MHMVHLVSYMVSGIMHAYNSNEGMLFSIVRCCHSLRDAINSMAVPRMLGGKNESRANYAAHLVFPKLFSIMLVGVVVELFHSLGGAELKLELIAFGVGASFGPRRDDVRAWGVFSFYRKSLHLASPRTYMANLSLSGLRRSSWGRVVCANEQLLS